MGWETLILWFWKNTQYWEVVMSNPGTRCQLDNLIKWCLVRWYFLMPQIKSKQNEKESHDKIKIKDLVIAVTYSGTQSGLSSSSTSMSNSLKFASWSTSWNCPLLNRSVWKSVWICKPSKLTHLTCTYLQLISTRKQMWQVNLHNVIFSNHFSSLKNIRLKMAKS